MILEIQYDDFTKKFGKKWAWRLKETITVLGKNFEQALWYAAQVPEWADYKSRMLYLGRVCGELSGLKEWLLPEVRFHREAGENSIPF